MQNMGWICPRCQKVHAPDVKGCGCQQMLEGPQWPPTIPSPGNPMPICGCIGPCGNVACPHAPKITCATFGQFSVANTGGNA